jgi:hypothetical protein
MSRTCQRLPLFYATLEEKKKGRILSKVVLLVLDRLGPLTATSSYVSLTSIRYVADDYFAPTTSRRGGTKLGCLPRGFSDYVYQDKLQIVVETTLRQEN